MSDNNGTTAPPAIPEATRLDDIARLGMWLALAESGSDNERARGAAAALRIYYAQRLGLSDIAAGELSFVRGKIVVGAKLLRARALDAGYRVERVLSTDLACTARLVDVATGEVVGETTYTMGQAERAGLVKEKSAWTTYPERMLWHRATKFVLDDFAPHVSLGLLEASEALEIIDGVAVEVSETSEPLSSSRGGSPREAESEPPQSTEDANAGQVVPPSPSQASEYDEHRQDTLLT